MENQRKVCILYHSGGGSTKTIGNIYHKKLKKYGVDQYPIDFEYDYNKLEEYDFFIFGFPTYHCDPSKSMLDFIHNMPKLSTAKRAFAYTTCGLYSANTIRIFGKECRKKNMILTGSAVYRSPATDGALLLPPIPFMFRYEKNIVRKLKKDLIQLEQLIKSNELEPKIPRFTLYSILNYPNKVLGKLYRHQLKVVKEHCIQCHRCMNHCIRGCFRKEDGYPKYEQRNCEFCFRCIHHCPKEAIILSKKTMKKPKLNEGFYEGLQKQIENEI